MSKGGSYPLFLDDGEHGGDAIVGAYLYLTERYRQFLEIYVDVQQLFVR
jgi:hypothetical protein